MDSTDRLTTSIILYFFHQWDHGYIRDASRCPFRARADSWQYRIFVFWDNQYASHNRMGSNEVVSEVRGVKVSEISENFNVEYYFALSLKSSGLML